MAKRSGLGSDPFGGKKGLDWIGGGQPPVQQAPKKPQKPWGEGGTSEEGLQEEKKRHTFIVRKRHVRQLKIMAAKENKNISDLVDEALRQYLD